jgi:Na+-transporting methylmalonyl-CoA/oxaloacetate decarboxylase gamma subunit
MGENLIIALQITAVGMGLVFLAIVLLWGLMAVLVRLTTQRKETAEGETEQTAAKAEMDRKKRAAIAAVGIALAQQADSMAPHEFPLPATPLVTAWQAVMRTRMHSKRGTSR